MSFIVVSSFVVFVMIIYSSGRLCQEGIVVIYYKKDVLQALKEVGYSTYRLQKEKLLSAGTVQKIREDDTSIQIETLNIICGMLQCQPGDILEWMPDEEEDSQ